MITDIPNPDDFRNHGIDYLNLSWGTVTQILLDINDADDWSNGLDDEMIADFWLASQRELATALSLAEQGVEFLLKSRICTISPWLLISRNPGDWPRRCDIEDVAYSQFRTIDAQDLLKVHNTYSAERLPVEFAQLFETLRKQRNAIMHTVDRNVRVTVTPLLGNILLAADYLLGSKVWVGQRRGFIDRDRRSTFEVGDNDYRVVREFLVVINLLDTSHLLRYFGFNKRQRAYACLNCCNAHDDVPLNAVTAQLRPNTPTSRTLYCFLCDSTIAVERRQCRNPECEGNVHSLDEKICLTCRRHPSEFE